MQDHRPNLTRACAANTRSRRTKAEIAVVSSCSHQAQWVEVGQTGGGVAEGETAVAVIVVAREAPRAVASVVAVAVMAQAAAVKARVAVALVAGRLVVAADNSAHPLVIVEAILAGVARMVASRVALKEVDLAVGRVVAATWARAEVGAAMGAAVKVLGVKGAGPMAAFEEKEAAATAVADVAALLEGREEGGRMVVAKGRCKGHY